MKDEEFQRKLELILERFEKIDLQVRKHFVGDNVYAKNQDSNKPYSHDTTISEYQHNKEN